VVRWLPFVVFGFGFAWFLPPVAQWQIFVGAAVLFVVWTLIHVLARTACARLVGFHPLLLRLGPLAAIATTTGWALLPAPARSIGGFEYEGRLDVPIGVGGLRWRLVALVLSGRAAFAMLAAALFAASVLRSSSLLVFVAILAALLLLDELIPWPRQKRSRATAGWWVWSWLRRPQASAQLTAIHMVWLQLALHHGLRPGQVHERWAELAAGEGRDATSGEDAEGSRLGYFCALDRGDIAAAAARIGRALAWTGHSGTALERSVVVESAFLAARFLDDVRKAERLLAERITVIDAGLVNDLSRAQAAVHMANGRFADALACCAAALEPVPVALPPDIELLRRAQGAEEPTGGHAAFHRDQVSAMRAAAQAVLEGAAPDRNP
jgi:hypothetical protein